MALLELLWFSSEFYTCKLLRFLVSGIFAITNKKYIGYIIYEKGGINSNRLIDFLNEFITTKYKDKLIILDNASSHRNQEVKDNI